MRFLTPFLHRRPLAIVAALAFAAALLLTPANAHAHATLESVVPTDGAELQAAPESIVITYTKDLAGLVRGVELQPPTGEPRTDAFTVDGNRIIVALPDDPEPGTWRTTWNVVAADGHVARESATFDLQRATRNDASSYPVATVERIGYIGHALLFAGLLAFVGAHLFALLVAPGWRPRLAAAALLTLCAGAWLTFAAQVALVNERTLLEMLDPRAWLSELASPAVRGYLLGAVLAAIAHARRGALAPAAWQERAGSIPRAHLAIVVAAAAAPALSGHTVDGRLLAIRIPLDALHVLAGAAWAGGLIQLRVLVGSHHLPAERIAASARRYAALAQVSVAVLVATGIYAVLDENGAGPGALLDSSWGRLVLAKLLLLAAALPLARINHTRNVPELAANPAEAAASLRRLVAVELAVIALVVLATAALVNASPPG